jgi:hypothetical protein
MSDSSKKKCPWALETEKEIIEELREVASRHSVDLGVVAVQLRHLVGEDLVHYHQYIWLLSQAKDITDLTLAHRIFSLYQQISIACLEQIVESVTAGAHAADDIAQVEWAERLRSVRNVVSALSEHTDMLSNLLVAQIKEVATNMGDAPEKPDEPESLPESAPPSAGDIELQDPTDDMSGLVDGSDEVSEEDVMSAVALFLMHKKKGTLS